MNKRKGLIIFLRLLVAIVIIAIILVMGIIFYNLMNKTSNMSLFGGDDQTEEASEDFISTESKVEDEDVIPNGDAAPQDEDVNETWNEDESIYVPKETDDTVHLAKADLSVFDSIQYAEDGETEVNPYDLIYVNLDSVEGSINYSSPGDPVLTQQLNSAYMILVDMDSNTVVAERNSEALINPASMTKVLTVLTARDYLTEEQLDDTFIITQDIVDYYSDNECSAVGFLADDEVTVRDLLYGTIICSGADATLGLARYCCGSEDVFVEKMNEKAKNLGLSKDAYFTNPVGVYDENLHCTVKDIAIVMAEAEKDELLYDVLGAHFYTTSVTYEDLGLPDGICLQNWYLEFIKDKEMNGTVMGAKTGFVDEAGFCAVSYYESNSGKKYVCVTANTFSSRRSVHDHVAMYRSDTK
ncbi:MAG: hypothetical protein K6E10_01840 [Eubacterium sp.]|nr:hypothetical protein [Eubacterium sp.]